MKWCIYDTKTLLEGYQKGIMDVAALKISKFGSISAVGNKLLKKILETIISCFLVSKINLKN
jgi:hypothetical protein